MKRALRIGEGGENEMNKITKMAVHLPNQETVTLTGHELRFNREVEQYYRQICIEVRNKDCKDWNVLGLYPLESGFTINANEKEGRAEQ